MTSPSEIAASAVRDELYARAAFARLIALPTPRFRAEVEADPMAQTEFMAAQIVDHYETNIATIPPEHGVELIEAARVAAREGEPHVRFRAEKDLANALRFLNRFASAEVALLCADRFSGQTFAHEVHRGTLAFSMAALREGTGHPDAAKVYAEEAVRIFEESGAHDRAQEASLFDAWMKLTSGEFLPALDAYKNAAGRARARGSEGSLAVAYQNIAHCYEGLEDFSAARRYFVREANTHRRRGCVVLVARSIRDAICMSIRMHGEAYAPDMEVARNAFLALGMAGEACRTTVAIMKHIFLRNPRADLSSYCRQLEEEARALGVLDVAYDALRSLNEAVRKQCVTEGLIYDVWLSFGPTWGFPGVSAVTTVEN